jgi:hypothetical protein
LVVRLGQKGVVPVDSEEYGWARKILGFRPLVAGLRTAASLRRNKAFINPGLEMETWDAVADGAHNSNTDLIHFGGAFYLAHQTSPWHFGSEESRLIVRRSADARQWEKMAEFQAPGEELRDPKFAVIGGRLFLYALRNRAWEPEPYTTVYTISEDGASWGPLIDVRPEGWLFWSPETIDSKTWHVPAYWREHGRSILLRSSDGVNWSKVSEIYEGERNDETAIKFLPDGRMIATLRLEGSGRVRGDSQASTMIAVAPPPYEEWSRVKSRVTRLDGPCLFSYGGQVFAAGRYQADRLAGLSEQGSAFSRKRTSLFLVREDGLTYLSDLPSSGDTSYAGAVVQGDAVYVSYYTSPIDKDYLWLIGMLSPTDIRMAKISLPSLARLAESPPAARIDSVSPWLELAAVVGVGVLAVVGLRGVSRRLCRR